MYCVEKCENKKRVHIPLEPQPTSEDLLEIQRYYTTLKADKTYKKRVTWVLHAPTTLKISKEHALLEYTGQFPGLRPHGLSKKNNIDYVRTPASTMELISEKTKTKTSRAAYNDILTTVDICDAPKDIQQVYNRKHYDQKTHSKRTTNVKNLADQLQTISSMSLTEPMIKAVNINKILAYLFTVKNKSWTLNDFVVLDRPH